MSIEPQELVGNADSKDTSNASGRRAPEPANPFVSEPVASPVIPLRVPAGTSLDRFLIVSHLGSGAVSEVYLAEDTRRKEQVAIKTIVTAPGDPEGVSSRLRQELAIHRLIQDPRHVVELHDVHCVPWGGAEVWILSMELASGGSLRQWLRDHRDDLDARLSQGLAYFMEQVCPCVAACHAAGVRHLDLKPENFLFFGDKLKLVDLHGALADAPSASEEAGTVCSHVELGFGTPEYMSPEHFTARCPGDLDARADVYSLGVMLFEICDPKGLPPFRGDHARLRDLHLTAAPPPLACANRDLASVVSRCLAKNPAERYQNATELLGALNGRTAVAPDDSEDQARRHADAAWQDACLSWRQGRFNDAMRQCRDVLSACPGHASARELLGLLERRQEQAGQLYAVLERDLENGGLDELHAVLKEATRLFPGHPLGQPVQVRLAIRARHYRQACEEGMAAATRREWAGAQLSFERASKLNPGSVLAQRALAIASEAVAHVRETQQSVADAIAEKDWGRVNRLARGIRQFLGEAKGGTTPGKGGR